MPRKSAENTVPRPPNLAIIPIAFRSIQGNLGKMVPDEESKPEVSEAEAPGAKASPRRDRRSGRGRRGRGRGGRSRQHSVPREPEELSPQTEPEAIFELAEDPARSAEP